MTNSFSAPWVEELEPLLKRILSAESPTSEGVSLIAHSLGHQLALTLLWSVVHAREDPNCPTSLGLCAAAFLEKNALREEERRGSKKIVEAYCRGIELAAEVLRDLARTESH